MKLSVWLNSLSLKVKIALIPVAILLLMVGININTFFNLSEVKSTTTLTTEVYAKEVKIASAILQNTLERQILIYQFLQSGEQAVIDSYNTRLTELKSITDSIGEITGIARSDLDSFEQAASLNQQVNDVFIGELVPNKQSIMAITANLINYITPSIIQEITDIQDLAEINELDEIRTTASEMSFAVMNARSFMQVFIMSQQEKDYERFEFEIDSAQSLYEDLQDEIEDSEFDGPMDHTGKLLKELSQEFASVRDKFHQNKKITKERLEVDITSTLNALLGLQDNIWQTLEESGEQSVDSVDNVNQSNMISTVILVVLSAVTISILAIQITKPLSEMLKTMTDMASGEGDIRSRLDVQGKDEVAQLGGQFNLFLEKLQSIIEQLASTTVSLHTSSERVSSEMTQCEQSVTVQQQETDQAAVAINEMASTSQEVSSNAANTLNTVREAELSVKSGDEAVASTFEDVNKLAGNIGSATEMTRSLSEQSNRVAGILSAIHAITDQTNLLALNAAIEAARAGEHGRGFAVVADAVRELATKTHQSTDEIQDIVEGLQKAAESAEKMMEDSNEQAKACVFEMSQVEESLAAINKAFTDIDGQMCLVASAMEQQVATVEEVNQNVVKINESSRQSLTSIAGSREESGQLLNHAQSLKAIVSEFKLDD
ncbi:methyl-accepting chemotaxis protein [Vibrio profundum]|uniref:methyl-accepting chemotaxis protein n=1 Tax=Vibrio profundum TaxID=2910247 RepID=UPI003D0C24CA